MKKWISLLLFLCMMSLVACDTAGTVSDTSSVSEVLSESSTDPHIITGDPSTFKHTLISVGKSYTVNSNAASDTYTDLFGQQMTDGQKTGDFGVPYTDVRMVGYTENVRFTIDLGEDGKRISGVSVRSLDLDRDGVALAASYRVYGSDDGKTNWETLGKMSFEPTGTQTMSTAALYFENLYNYRYIRISVQMQGNFFFTDEIEVYADVDEKEEATDGAASLYANETLDRNAWKALSTGEAVYAYSTNAALNKTYRFEGCTFDERAPQNDTYLTDGTRTGRLFGEALWVGFRASGDPSVILDLGEVRNDLYAFRLHTLGSGLNVSLPDAIDVYASEDGEVYTLLGRIYAPAACDNHAYTLILPEYIGARYVKFSVTVGEGNCWVEEIEVMAGFETVIDDEQYPPLAFTYPVEEVYWDSSNSDYTQTQNLLLGVPQQIASSGYVIPAELDTDPVKESEWDCPVLTDGKLANDMYCYGGEWFYSSGGNALDIFFDLGALSTVESLHISLLEQTDWGVTRPKYMSVFLSEDGENWYKVYDYDRAAESASFFADATRVTFDCELETPYAARFVRFRIESAMLFIDELQVFGTKKVSDSTARLEDSGINSVIYYTDPDRKQYANSENTSVKANDIVCFYGDYGDEAMMKAYVAYLDEDGNAVDTLMDGFLYGAEATIPSNAVNHLENYKIDWEFYFDTIFNGVVGLDVLDKVVGEVKEELNRPDHKVYVYITMLSVMEAVTDFGDVDGDGVSENLSVASDREKVVNWYTDMCMTEFASRGYEHIVLDGFYWHNESVSYENDDSDIITEVSEYIHDANTNFLWIPYYTANRYQLGYELGFDLVCMQPNYMFDLLQPLYRFTVTASRTERQHMCVEIEHTGAAIYDPLYVQNYMLYLYYGAVTGYMNGATHIYYNDLDNFAQLAYSDNPLCRMQYDATYRFIEGTLEVTPETPETVRVSGAKDTVFTGKLESGESISRFTLASSPENGYVTLSSDGSFRYFPDKGYTGTDSFTYTYNNYLGESEICTVEVQIG